MNNTKTLQHSESVPLCVDLDGTLLRSDMLLESLFVMLRQRPRLLVCIPFWLLRGKAYLKAQIAARVDFTDAFLPFNEDVVSFVREQAQHRHVVLVTGSNRQLAEAVVAPLQLFDEIAGSSDETNLTSHRKKAWLVERFGTDGFDYIGNDRDDLDVWPAAREALAVSTPGGIATDSSVQFSRVFEQPSNTLAEYLSMLRVHQWSKNALIAVPFVLDHRLMDASAARATLFAFFAMSMLASITYIFNDMLDLQADRQNPTKSKRMLASGRVSLANGIVMMGMLTLVLLSLCVMLPLMFNLVLLVYLITTLTYSFLLKRHAMLDVISIAAMHTLRVIAGSVVISAVLSFWLLAFSMFFFFSLACAKRVAELINLQALDREHTIGRDYQVSDIPVMVAAGVSTGFISIMVVSLYINSDKVQTLYTNPMILWLLCPVLMYWIGRIWIYTARGRMHEDPIVFAMRDRVSVFSAMVLGTIVIVAMLYGAGAQS